MEFSGRNSGAGVGVVAHGRTYKILGRNSLGNLLIVDPERPNLDLGAAKEAGWLPDNFDKVKCGCTRELVCEEHSVSWKASCSVPEECGACAKAELKQTLPEGSKDRKGIPLATGCFYYFPAALAYVAKISKAGNDKHNPGQPMHHARGKSSDHADCILRHQVDAGKVDPEDNLRHSGKVAWRALAQLQEELEAAGEAPLARGAKLP